MKNQTENLTRNAAVAALVAIRQEVACLCFENGVSRDLLNRVVDLKNDLLIEQFEGADQTELICDSRAFLIKTFQQTLDDLFVEKNRIIDYDSYEESMEYANENDFAFYYQNL